MTAEKCAEMQSLIQADLDGELSPAEAARIGRHVEACAACAEMQERLIALSQRLRLEVPYHGAPEALRAVVQARVRALATPAAATPFVAAKSRIVPWGSMRGGPFGTGFALAACLALVLLWPGTEPRPDSLMDGVVASHIRGLQPGHLTDVVSTDQHTVKPWFDGRLDYAPPVRDFAAEGFPLIGGRLDYVGGRPVAALAYQRRQHIVQLFAWPAGDVAESEPVSGSRSGYNFVRWQRDGMSFWAVSDLGPDELAAFVRLWRT